jgi:tetratricopeptide (TPR) repeat protein
MTLDGASRGGSTIMGSVVCTYCEETVHESHLFCGRCGGRPRGETAAERALSGLMLVERLIDQRVWFGLEKELSAIKALLDGGDHVYQACEPALNRLVQQVSQRLELEPDIPRLVKVARLVLGLVRRGGVQAEIRDKVARLEQFTKALREADQSWSGGRPPSQRKASAWLAEQAELAGMTADDARESVYETPEYWPAVAAAVDPEVSERVFWKVEVAQAEAEFKAEKYKTARVLLTDVLAREKDCARAHEAQARVFQARGQTDQAIAQLRAAVRKGTADPTAWNNLAWYLVTGRTPNESELEVALWAARRAIALAPRSPCWDTLAEVLFRKGNIPDAIAAAREVLRLDPDRPDYRERMRALCAALPTLKTPPGSGPAKQHPNSTTLRPDLPDFPPGKTDEDIFDDSDFVPELSGEVTAAQRSEGGSDFNLTALDASDDFEASPLAGPSDSNVTATQPSAPGINLARPSDSGINLQGLSGFDLSQADSIDLAPLDGDDAPAKPAPKAKPASAKANGEPNSATVMPGITPTDPGDTSMGITAKDNFDDTDFSLEVASLDSDHDDRTVEIDRSSDFDLEESESSSEVFALDEDDVDQNAATSMGAAIAGRDDDSDEFSADDAGSGETSGWDVESEAAAPTSASPVGRSGRPGSSARPHPKAAPKAASPGLFRRILDPLRKAAASLTRSKSVKETDRVQFSLTAPSTLEPGCPYALDVWAYIEAQRTQMLALAKESQGTDDIRVKTKDGVVIERGVVLTVRLDIPTMDVDDPVDVIAWDGKIGNATFPVKVPAQTRSGPHAGTAMFLVDLLPIAKLHFVLEVGRGPSVVAPLAAREFRRKSAFASYANEDRDEVLGRLQGIMKVLPDLDVFIDVKSLRAGERWEKRLYQEIERRETLYLFWSLAASRSEWVDREWRHALAKRDIHGIDPVPLVSPEEVPPPPELAQHLHFNDGLLAYMRGRRETRSGDAQLA